MLAFVARLARQGAWLLSDRGVSQAFNVGWFADDADTPLVKARLFEALDLLATVWPRWLTRMRPYVQSIWVYPLFRAHGEWNHDLRQVALDLEFVCAEGRSAASIASVLVHEFTHGRLDAVGIQYESGMRVRVEQACTRQQIAFVGALPDSADKRRMIEGLTLQLDRPAEFWGVAAFSERNARALERQGAPAWMVKTSLWLRRAHSSSNGPA